MGITKQKCAVKQVIDASAVHMTAEEVYQKVRETMPSISMATVYRNLNKMAGSGEIVRLLFPDGKYRFDKGTGVHGHCYCLSCGSAFDIEPAPSIAALRGMLSFDPSFEAGSCEITIKGLCAKCRAKAEKAAKH